MQDRARKLAREAGRHARRLAGPGGGSGLGAKPAKRDRRPCSPRTVAPRTRPVARPMCGRTHAAPRVKEPCTDQHSERPSTATHPHPCQRSRRPGDARRRRLLLGLRLDPAPATTRSKDSGSSPASASARDAGDAGAGGRVRDAAASPARCSRRRRWSELVPKGTKSGKAGKSDDAATRGNCSWTSLDNNGVNGSQFRWLNVSLLRFESDAARGTGDKLAHDVLRRSRSTDAQSVTGAKNTEVGAGDRDGRRGDGGDVTT